MLSVYIQMTYLLVGPIKWNPWSMLSFPSPSVSNGAIAVNTGSTVGFPSSIYFSFSLFWFCLGVWALPHTRMVVLPSPLSVINSIIQTEVNLHVGLPRLLRKLIFQVEISVSCHQKHLISKVCLFSMIPGILVIHIFFLWFANITSIL